MIVKQLSVGGPIAVFLCLLGTLKTKKSILARMLLLIQSIMLFITMKRL